MNWGFPTGADGGNGGGGGNATSIQGVPVPHPSGNDTYLHYNGVTLEWIPLVADISPGWVFAEDPPNEGELWYCSGPNELRRAQNDDPNRILIYGVVPANPTDAILIGRRDIGVRFKAGETPISGRRWWLSEISGLATSVEPSVSGRFFVPGGVIRNITRYAADSICFCLFDPGPIGGPI